MKSKIINSAALTLCGILFWMVALDINGKWTGSVDYNGNPLNIAYNFKAEGNKVTGTILTPLGESSITDGKLENDQLTFTVELNGAVIPHAAKVYPDSIVMKIDYNGSEMNTTLKRAKK